MGDFFGLSTSKIQDIDLQTTKLQSHMAFLIISSSDDSERHPTQWRRLLGRTEVSSALTVGSLPQCGVTWCSVYHRLLHGTLFSLTVNCTVWTGKQRTIYCVNSISYHIKLKRLVTEITKLKIVDSIPKIAKAKAAMEVATKKYKTNDQHNSYLRQA